MILLYENALLTLQNGQETQNFPPRGGLFSETLPVSLFLFVYIHVFQLTVQTSGKKKNTM